jgi:hypothetical protein
MKVVGFLGTMLLMAVAFSACGSGGDGSMAFATGLDGDHHTTGQKSTFSAGQKFYHDATLKDTVKGNTIAVQLIGPKGQTLANTHVLHSAKDANHIWAGPVNLTMVRAAGGAGTYTLKMMSGGKEEAQGSFSIG